MMELIIGRRATGKTIKTVYSAAKNNGIIWVAQYPTREYVRQIARQLNVECPPVYTIQDIIEGKPYSLPFAKRIAYVDDLENFLMSIGKFKFRIMQVNCCPERTYVSDKGWLNGNWEGEEE